jgi:hypothetical protein
MDIKARLQRALQILTESERVNGFSDLERDILLNDLREVYAELKFGKTKNECCDGDSMAAVEKLVAESDEPIVDEEPEVEVELIFNESDEYDDESAAADESDTEEPVAIEAAAEADVEATSATECSEESVAPIIPKRSRLLSLYDDEVVPVLGEQFHEQPSVADVVACPKGVADITPVVSLRDAIGVADRFMLIRELFEGDSDAYEKAINGLESQPSFDDCVIFISENYAWRAQSEGVKVLMTLLQRKFNC